MRKWLTVGALILVALWGPYLYAELTHAPVETKGTPTADLDDEDPFADPEPGAEEEAPAAEAVEDEEPSVADNDQAENDEVAEDEVVPEEEPIIEEDLDQVAEAPAAQMGREGEPEGNQEGEGDEGEDVPPIPMTTALAPMIGAGVHALPTLKAAYENETRDALWAGDAEARLLGMLGAAQMPADVIESTHCQKTVCRIELSWNQEFHEAYTKAYDNLRDTFGANIGVAPLDTQADVERVAMYVPREGYTLADLQQ